MGNTWSKLKSEKNGFTLIELIIVIVILGIIAGVAIPKFIGVSDEARLSVARGVGRALSSTIAIQHSNYIVTGVDYNVDTIINDTQFQGVVNTPTVSGNTITYGHGPGVYNWSYTPRNNSDSAFITEDTSSDF